MIRNLAVLVGIVIIFIGLILVGVSYRAIVTSYEYKGNILNPPVAVPDFQLQAVDGSLFRLSDLEGKIALIFLGYTNCPDVCPLTVAKVKQALNNLDEADREKVQFIFISVDPERDTPEVLAKYLNHFDAGFIGLTDDPEKVQEVMKSFWAYAGKEENPEVAAPHSETGHGHEEASLDYLVNHTGRVYLVTPERELILMYPMEFKAEDLRNDLVYLLN